MKQFTIEFIIICGMVPYLYPTCVALYLLLIAPCFHLPVFFLPRAVYLQQYMAEDDVTLTSFVVNLSLTLEQCVKGMYDRVL